ncbi:MAG: hypothetical protein C4520_15340 [Candidatus Abyssobacteria bacterium SURF_5]|uniref:Peptidase C39-like domain-containing protein n=1 Tax=Abyssobacteria bacterium (strain SURF_5) TaxID=2093360 RepID=A0A3A4NA32_ABYX5|nr:MAG: hypothetical protein C4520_15340 [Candidatus Abyssubacteria bacterium SURF_5]
MSRAKKSFHCLTITFVLLVLPFAVSIADEVLLQELSPDAQSTTGPVPPEGTFPGFAPAALDYEVVIPDVPAYLWTNGCGPTAAGMVVGYWDGQGFDELVEGDASTQTAAVDAMISSSGNYSDYCLPLDSAPGPLLPDLSEPPAGDEHPHDSVADFMKTSQSASSNYYGWSWFSHVDDALAGYIALAGPQYTAHMENLVLDLFTWARFCEEIDAGQPVILLVDTGGDGSTDHFVTAVGYGEFGGTQMYACLNTWDRSIHWFAFERIGVGQPWGIFGATLFYLEPPPLTGIQLSSPADGSAISSPPEFAWTADGGVDNVFAVDGSLSADFSTYWSTYEDMHQLIAGTSWLMPAAVWNKIPAGRTIYWRVRGADLSQTPLTVISSDQVWSFVKQ